MQNTESSPTHTVTIQIKPEDAKQITSVVQDLIELSAKMPKGFGLIGN